MFEFLSHKISQLVRGISGSGRLTESNVKDTLDKIYVALLEADVALPVARDFINTVKENVIGKNVSKLLTPSQELVKIIHSTLVQTIGSDCSELNLDVHRISPKVILFVGSQGSGKTTTVAKLSKFLKNRNKRKILVSSTDVYRPAGIYQLKTMVFGEKIDFFSDCISNNAIDIARQALVQAKNKLYDILLIDTAGCLDTEHASLLELKKIYDIVNPVEVFFVIDSMIGQVSINNINVFNKIFPITGVVLTKLDGDARGGVALSIKYLTKKPIKFIGIGENINDLEVFYPDRVAGRILGMGDILSLIEDIENQSKNCASATLDSENKVHSDFNLCDFLVYIKQIQNMGGIKKIIDKLPNLGMYMKNDQQFYMHEKVIMHMEAIINSMTIRERVYPDIINGSRKRRIAIGAGVRVQDVNKLLTQFHHMRIAMKDIKKHGKSGLLRKLRDKISLNFPMR